MPASARVRPRRRRAARRPRRGRRVWARLGAGRPSSPGEQRALLATLRRLRGGSRYVVVMRHAERQSTPRSDLASGWRWSRPVTMQGHRLARDFGEQLPAFRRLSVAYSSVPRCRQTAIDIVVGYHRTHPEAPIFIEGIDEGLTGQRLRSWRGGSDSGGRPDRSGRWIRLEGDGRARRSGGSGPRPPRDAGVPEAVASALERAGDDPPGSARILVGHRAGLFRVGRRVFGNALLGRRTVGYLDGIVFRLGPDGAVTAHGAGRWKRLDVRGVTP